MYLNVLMNTSHGGLACLYDTSISGKWITQRLDRSLGNVNKCFARSDSTSVDGRKLEMRINRRCPNKFDEIAQNVCVFT